MPILLYSPIRQGIGKSYCYAGTCEKLPAVLFASVSQAGIVSSRTECQIEILKEFFPFWKVALLGVWNWDKYPKSFLFKEFSHSTWIAIIQHKENNFPVIPVAGELGLTSFRMVH